MYLTLNCRIINYVAVKVFDVTEKCIKLQLHLTVVSCIFKETLVNVFAKCYTVRTIGFNILETDAYFC